MKKIFEKLFPRDTSARCILMLLTMAVASSLLFWGGEVYKDRKKSQELGVSSNERDALRNKRSEILILYRDDQGKANVLAKQDFAETVLAVKERNPGFPKKTRGPAYARDMQKAEARVKTSCTDADSDACVQAKVEYADAVLRAVEL